MPGPVRPGELMDQDHLVPMQARLGTAVAEPARIYTRGVLRWEVDPASGALVACIHTEPVSTVQPQFFYRMSGGKWQLCTLFPSGATQIIATEP